MKKTGAELEKIVELIERSISPDATVEQNVFLPVLSSTEGHTAQCDIVIRKGNKLRETLTIVEVQDRSYKVDINTFRGWLGKMEDVGAQHLICVSRKEFPSSIKEKVSKRGANIFLITIRDLSPDQIPLDFINFKFQYRHLYITDIKSLRPYVAPGQIETLGLKPLSLNLNDKVWSLDKQNLVSFFDICKGTLDIKKTDTSISEFIGGTSSMSFALDAEESIFYLHDGELIRIGLDCKFNWELDYAETPMSVASYEQDDHGTLAWIFEVNHNGKNGMVSVKLPVIQLDNGYFKLLDSVVNANFNYSLDVVNINN